MGNIKRSPVWDDPRVKPPYGSVELDPSHPLARGLGACWLFHEGAGVTSRDFSPNQWTTTGTDVVWQPTARGVAVSLTGSAKIVIPMAATAQVFSVAARFLVTGTSGYRGLLGKASADAVQEIRVNATSNTVSLMKQNTAQIGVTSAGIAANVVTDLVVTYDASGNYAFYLNGKLDSSGTNLQTFTVSVDPCLGNSADGVLDGSILHFYYYPNCVLTEGEALQQSADPYAMFRPIIRRRYVVPAAAGDNVNITPPTAVRLGV